MGAQLIQEVKRGADFANLVNRRGWSRANDRVVAQAEFVEVSCCRNDRLANREVHKALSCKRVADARWTSESDREAHLESRS